MPIKGNERQARPRDIFNCFPCADGIPKPGKSQTFGGYLKQADRGGALDDFDSLLLYLMALGDDEPNRQDYLNRLETSRELLALLHKELYDLWTETSE